MRELLTEPYATVRLLEEYGIHARKKYGQNFLIDGSVIRRAIEAACITKEDCVLEIGPGIGTMTQHLCMAAGKVIAVEIDEGLRPVLADTLQDFDNVQVLFQDILRTDLRGLSEQYHGGRRLKCVANLPYYITTPILIRLLQEKGLFESITVMVQKEVADRICATEKDKEYGALSLAVQYYSQPQIVAAVPPNCFIPRPGVDSAVLCMKAYEVPPAETNEELLFAVIRASFNQRRKTLANALSHGLQYEGRTFSREEVTAALEAVGKPADVRGEKLSLSDFAAFTNALSAETGK
ncbi:MAG: 16S rRNA (adenine(1518)-N(6)/adenine(1519)-N(6))-dimethyltransferase RsmA [Lachnospiraceae bacterium]|nr:16S rRNA (adenine(1518)-N(6)/adenine(1519)-N(6))-dimethyltransferase RsmA [Lachnospiraceae bacterium]